MSRRQSPALLQGTGAVIRGLCRLFGGFSVRGLENIPATGPAIIAGNHLSWLDPPALRSVIRRQCWFLGNDFLFQHPLLGKLLPLYGGFPVRRGVIDRDALRAAESHLKEGDLLVIFPEGGTTITGTLYPFEGGVAMLALRAGVPIVPVGLTGTEKLLPLKHPWPHFARGGVSLTFGKAIHPSEIDPALPHRRRIELLTERLYASIAGLLPPEYVPGEYRAGVPFADLPRPKPADLPA
jgi:1-acyl-sn-glycerol-3-phosphate acyltransferase